MRSEETTVFMVLDIMFAPSSRPIHLKFNLANPIFFSLPILSGPNMALGVAHLLHNHRHHTFRSYHYVLTPIVFPQHNLRYCNPVSSIPIAPYLFQPLALFPILPPLRLSFSSSSVCSYFYISSASSHRRKNQGHER